MEARPTASRIVNTLKAVFRARITTGLLVVLPVYVTYLLVRFIFELMRDASQWLVEAYITTEFGASVRRFFQIDLDSLKASLGHNPTPAEMVAALPAWMQWVISIFSVLVTIFLLYAIGLFAANVFGKRLLLRMERMVDHLPFVKTVYRSSKQILETLAGDQTKNFQRVALIPFPQERMRCVGFITSTFHDSVSGEELATVFIPTTPNPTTGYLQILRRVELVEVDWSVEEAVRTIMSGGILRPEHLTIVPSGRPELPQRPLGR
ncbi:MAG: DUF502 domain-containing protein [Phycisphaerales bacterium]|nr:DUF502 domain-containing protein [Phycisphaerales bacterium]